MRDELQFYATGARPDLAKEMGFIGGKLPLQHGPPKARKGLRKNIDKLADMRSRVGDDFWLMFDCWMSLDVRLRDAPRARGARARAEVARGSACRPTTTGATPNCAARVPRGHDGDDRRARGDALGLSHAARDGMLRS